MTSRPTAAVRRGAAALLAVVLAGVTLGPAAAADTTTPPVTDAPSESAPPDSAPPESAPPDSREEPSTPEIAAYGGNPVTEAVLVADEDTRLNEVRTVTSMVRWRQLDLTSAYRLTTGGAYTLVLTRREADYTINDLLELAPQTFVREPDGAFLLTENIVIQPGATLNLTAAGGLTIRLASDAERFVSIVNYGGKLVTKGTGSEPVVITSWDRTAGAPDTLTDDGRAYVRSIGGQVDLRSTQFQDLGFWSGRTGGVALTGTDRPTGGALEDFGRALRDNVGAMNEQSTADPIGDAADESETEGTDGEAAAEDDEATEDEGSAADGGTVSGAPEGVLPAGELPIPEIDLTDPTYSYVAARVTDVHITGNTFGLFLSSANGVDISDSTVEDSLVDGLVLHRFVSNAAISTTTVAGSRNNGIVLSRASTGIVLNEVRSIGNAHNGIEFRGESLADGPSATGSPVGEYGNNSVANSEIRDNGHHGIEVVGGENVSINANDIGGNDMGIVVRDPATEVKIVGNHLTGNTRHGLALRDGVLSALVSGNVVSDGENGIYVRDSTADVYRNTVSGMTRHAITLVGDVAGTTVEENGVAGRGPSAIDVKRSDGAEVSDNDQSDWTSTKPFWTLVRNAAQPLTVMWVLLALIVVVTALRGLGRPARRRHPYAAQMRLAEIAGEVEFDGTDTRATGEAHPRRADTHGTNGTHDGDVPVFRTRAERRRYRTTATEDALVGASAGDGIGRNGDDGSGGDRDDRF